MKLGIDTFEKIGSFFLYAGIIGFIVFIVYRETTHVKRCIKAMETVSPKESDKDYFDALAGAFTRLTYGKNTLEISKQTSGKYVLQVDDIKFPVGPLEAEGDVVVGARQDSVRLHSQLVRMCQARLPLVGRIRLRYVGVLGELLNPPEWWERQTEEGLSVEYVVDLYPDGELQKNLGSKQIEQLIERKQKIVGNTATGCVWKEKHQ